MKKTTLLEVCANSVASALAGQEGGAFRVELCENLNEGGTTPTYGAIAIARKLIAIKLNILIRPRSGDFLYTDLEFEVMKADIKLCIQAKCDGIVVGILNGDGTIDVPRCNELAELASQAGLSTTFHRAFDMCANQFEALEQIIDMGFDRILTSGGKSTAIEGARRIAELVEKAAGRIIIMPGSGINENNVADLVHFTRVTEVHSSAKVHIPSKMSYKNDHIIMDDLSGDEYSMDITDAEKVSAIVKAANS
ncbi:MAG: copper homeostasis protein CutC [Mucilaginibacter sp.]